MARMILFAFALVLALVNDQPAAAAPTAGIGKVETHGLSLTAPAASSLLQSKLSALLGAGKPFEKCALDFGGSSGAYVVDAQITGNGGQVTWALTLRNAATGSMVASAIYAGRVETLEQDAAAALAKLLDRACPVLARKAKPAETPPPVLPPTRPPPASADNPVSGTIQMSTIFDYAASSHTADSVPATRGQRFSLINKEPYTDESWDLHGEFVWQYQTLGSRLLVQEAGVRTYNLWGREQDFARAKSESVRDRMGMCSSAPYYPRIEEMRKVTHQGRVDIGHSAERIGFSSGSQLRIKGTGAGRRFELELKNSFIVAQNKDGVLSVIQESEGCGAPHISSPSTSNVTWLITARAGANVVLEGPVAADGTISGRFAINGKYVVPKTWSTNTAPEDAPVDFVVDLDLKVIE